MNMMDNAVEFPLESSTSSAQMEPDTSSTFFTQLPLSTLGYDEAPTLASLPSGERVISSINSLRSLIKVLPDRISNLGAITEAECWVAYRSQVRSVKEELISLRSKTFEISDGSLTSERDKWQSDVDITTDEVLQYQKEVEKWRARLSEIRAQMKDLEKQILDKRVDRENRTRRSGRDSTPAKKPKLPAVHPSPVLPSASPLELKLKLLKAELRSRKSSLAQKFADQVLLSGIFEECAKEALKARQLNLDEIDQLRKRLSFR